ncbi:hypothetical protein [Paenibacillus humicus]|uniref:hypothetical protein n=1 Tax=Paenibacillus humicus TaxID=412861 RepID=UPI000FDAA60B|nr:hypothetical protein [Paenibacillus humicus]
MDRTLVKKMAREVSVETLGGFIVSYAKEFAGKTDVNAEMEETLATLEDLIAEMRRRVGGGETKVARKPRKPRTETPTPIITNSNADETDDDDTPSRPTSFIGNGGGSR